MAVRKISASPCSTPLERKVSPTLESKRKSPPWNPPAAPAISNSPTPFVPNLSPPDCCSKSPKTVCAGAGSSDQLGTENCEPTTDSWLSQRPLAERGISARRCRWERKPAGSTVSSIRVSILCSVSRFGFALYALYKRLQKRLRSLLASAEVLWIARRFLRIELFAGLQCRHQGHDV